MLLFVIVIWIPLLIFFSRKFGYKKVWGCSAVAMGILLILSGTASCLK